MGEYELYFSSSLCHSETFNDYELYHHGVKGQKWGVIRDRHRQKRAAKKKQRSKLAGERIKKHGGSKSTAAAFRVGAGYLRNVGVSFLTSAAATQTLSIAMNAVVPEVAAVAFVATTAIALADQGYRITNIYRTGREVYDIAKHEDSSYYLEHHGIKGQRWGVRRFQDESGSLTGLGKQRLGLDTSWHPQKGHSSGDTLTDIHNDIAAVNHNGSHYEIGRGTNCLYCTTAYEMRRRGYDVQAQQDWVGGIRGDMPEAMYKGAVQEPVFNLTEIPLNHPDRLEYGMAATNTLISTVEAQGEGARGYVGVVWGGGQGGHSMAYEVVDGKMHLIDCQTGEDLTGDDIFWEKMVYADYCSITRVDNCEINKELVDRYIEDYGTEDSLNAKDEMLDRLLEKLRKRRKKKKNKKVSSLKKMVNRYDRKVSSIWNSTKRNTSRRASSFVSNTRGLI